MPPTGVVTLKDLIDGVRDTLAAWAIPSKLDGAVALGDTVINLESGISEEFVGQRALLEVNDEIMLVTKINSSTQYEVIRAYQGSDAAAHGNGDDVKIHPSWSWTDRVIRYDYIPKAIRWIRPEAWVIGVGEPFVWQEGTRSAQLPVYDKSDYPHGNQIIKLEYESTPGGDWLPFYNWQQEGPYLRFGKRASRNWNLHAVLAVQQRLLPDLTSSLDNDAWEEAIVTYASHLAMNSLKTNRARYVDYAAALNDRASTPDELIRVSFDLKNQAILAKEQASRPLPPNYLKTYRDPG